MRLKKHAAVVAFHSQLSAILEKLMVLAVEEIKELVFDFCEEIGEEKTPNKDENERTRGEEQRESVYLPSESFYAERNEHGEPQDQVSPTSSREDVKEKHGSQPNYTKYPNAFSNNEQEGVPTSCKFEEVATTSKNPSYGQEEDCSHDESRQSNFEPPEDSKKHLIDYNSPEETFEEDISPNQNHSRDAEFRIKQEEETPSFETGNCTRFQMQTGQMKTEAQPAPQGFLLVNQASYNPSYNVAFASLDMPRPFHTNVRQNWDKSSTNQTLPESNKALFKCEYCSKMYRFPSLLKAHYMKHTKEKQLACRFCGKLFKWEYSLRRHERMYCGQF